MAILESPVCCAFHASHSGQCPKLTWEFVLHLERRDGGGVGGGWVCGLSLWQIKIAVHSIINNLHDIHLSTLQENKQENKKPSFT